MVRNLDDSFFTWMKHHIGQGFNRFYLIFDAPEEDREVFTRVPDFESSEVSIRLISNNEEHRELLRKHEPELAASVFSENNVVRRQLLNVSWVMNFAIQDGMNWLLHIDSDELIAPYESTSLVTEYLASVDRHFDEVIFPNFEAVPETTEMSNPFFEVSLFRKSPYYMRYREFEHLYTGWHGRTGTYKLFNSYITGKSALRMKDVDVPFVPFSVHHFLPLRFTKNVLIEDRGGPAIFHYPNCGYERFVQRFTGANIDRINTYEESSFGDQDLYGRAQKLAQEQDWDGLEKCYRELVMIEDPKLMRYLVEKEYVIRKKVLTDS